MRKKIISKLGDTKFEIWRVIFLESVLPLKNHGMDFRISGNNENIFSSLISLKTGSTCLFFA